MNGVRHGADRAVSVLVPEGDPGPLDLVFLPGGDDELLQVATGVRNVENDSVDVDLHVQQALDRSVLDPDDSDVKSGTKDNVITLTGHVRTRAEHDPVVGAAWMALGVIEVRDELQSPAEHRHRGHPVLASERWRQRQNPLRPGPAAPRHPASARIRLASSVPRRARRPAS